MKRIQDYVYIIDATHQYVFRLCCPEIRPKTHSPIYQREMRSYPPSYRGGINWRVDAQRTDCNNETIEELLSSARHMLHLIDDEYEYYEAANEIERTLVRMNRIREASSLYV